MKKILMLLYAIFILAYNMNAVVFKVGNITYSAQNASVSTATVEKGTGGVIIIPQTVTYGSKTFTVTALSNCAFVDGGMEELEIPSSLTEIRYDDSGGLLHGNRYLKKIIVAEDNPAFCDVNGVMFTKDMEILIAYPPAHTSNSHYDVPEGVKCIGKTAFECSQNLRTITLPPNLKSIQLAAFNASGIESINLPKSVNYLGHLCIRKVSMLPFYLKSIYVNWDIPINLTGDDTFSQEIYTDVTLYVPLGTKSLYEAAPVWGNFFSIEEFDASNITEIFVDSHDDCQYFDLNGRASDGSNGIIIKVDKSGRAKKYILNRH